MVDRAVGKPEVAELLPVDNAVLDVHKLPELST
jgi:hypothetical protein